MYITVLFCPAQFGAALAAADYWWQCTQPTLENGIVYFPNIVPPVLSTIRGPSPELELSLTGAGYVYQIPPSVLTNCSGTITTINYCYQSEDSGGNKTVFTFFVLQDENPNTLRIVDRFDVWSKPTNDTCHPNIGGKCCDSFDVPRTNLSLNITFGVLTDGTSGYNLLAFHSTDRDNVGPGFLLTATEQVTIGEEFTRQTVTSIVLRLLQFVISKLS